VAGLMGVLGGLLALVALVGGARPSLLSPRRWRAKTRAWRKRRGKSRPPLPAKMRRLILRVDRWACVFCGSPDRPEVDHIYPYAWGFCAWRWNLAVLCKFHNEVKSGYYVDRAGRVHYRPWPWANDRAMAAEILARELEARRSPARLVRMFVLRGL
jgi:5-methylcytosine-specific restriction endonuclease McrA